jgi:hypothetical protein
VVPVVKCIGLTTTNDHEGCAISPVVTNESISPFRSDVCLVPNVGP